MGKKVVTYDVVGATETKEILKVELQRISRWLKSGRLPAPYADLALSPVWLRADIERVKETGSVDGATVPPWPPHLIGTAEVALFLGVGKSQIARWRSRPNKSGPAFPEPTTRVVAGPLWSWQDVSDYGVVRGSDPAGADRVLESITGRAAARQSKPEEKE
jgi:hypothetical protein